MLFSCDESHSEHSKFNFEGKQIVSEVSFRRAYWNVIFEKGVNCELIFFTKFFAKIGRMCQGRFPRVFLKKRSECSVELLAKSSFQKNVDICTLLSKLSKKNEFLSKAILRGTKTASHISRRTLLVNFFKNFL